MAQTGSNGATPNAIEVSDLRHSFDHQQVLRGVDLDCPRGHVTTIVGPSGCGKTVLLKHLNLLLRPDSGRINIEGVEVSRLRGRALDQVRSGFGMLFQGGALFDSMSVFDNVAFPLVEKARLSRDEISSRVHAMLASVGLEAMEKKFPSEMSGGMQKRAALARALIHEPRILMLDEPTTGLDPTRTGSIHTLVRETQQRLGLTAVLVSHDVPQVFQISDRVAFMHEGRMRLVGTPQEMMATEDDVFQKFLAGKAALDEDAAALD